MVDRLARKHDYHLQLYADNARRMPGEKEAYMKREFIVGIGDKNASIRIPSFTVASKRGEIEDRRPPSDMNPYLVTALLVDTIVSD